ncbi:TerC family protein [Candidatus Hepatincola sp. Av]
MLDLFLSFIFLLFLEIILGVDNIIFIALLSNQVPKHLQKRVRFFGLILSLVLRLVALFSIILLLKMATPLFYIMGVPISYKSLITLFGGLFLIAKATSAIHAEVVNNKSNKKDEAKINVKKHTVFFIILQIIAIDFVFSLDSLLTAIGLSNHFYVIAAAIIGSIIFMFLFSNMVANFIAKYTTLKILALAFILMIGVFLFLEGVEIHVNKGYLYFAMGFALIVELINNLVRDRKKG